MSTNQTLEQMNQTVSDGAAAEVSDALMHLADKIGYTVSELYMIFVKAQAYKGGLTLGLTALWMLSTGYVTRYTYRLGVSWEGDAQSTDYDSLHNVVGAEDWTRDDTITLAAIAGTVTGLFLLLLLSTVVYDALLNILVPEYTGAKEMLDLARSAL